MHTSRTIGYSHDTERTLKRTATQLFVDRQQHGRHARHARTHTRTQARAYVGTHARTHPPARPRATRPPAHPPTHAPTHPSPTPARIHENMLETFRTIDQLMCYIVAKILVTEVHTHKKPNWHYILRPVLEVWTILVQKTALPIQRSRVSYCRWC